MSMEDPEAAKRAFEEYQREREGHPIDPRAEEEGRREILLDQLHRRPRYHENVPDKAEMIAGLPDGDLFKTIVADKDIPEAIERLSAARRVLMEAIDLEILGSRPLKLEELEESTLGAGIPDQISGKVSDAMEAIQTYTRINSETQVTDLPMELLTIISNLRHQQYKIDHKHKGIEN